MNATELIIGDYFYRPACVDRVVEVRTNGVIGTDSLRGLISWSEIESVPLSVEILEKNGFERTYRQGDLLFFNGNTMIEAGGKLFHDNRFYLNEIMIPLFYVHELQHALRLCGLNDLADNFKIY